MLASALVRRQMIVFLAGMLLTTAVTVIPTLFGYRPPFVASVVVFSVILALFGWVLFRYHFFDTFPIGFQMVYLSLKDPVMVLNQRGEVIQANSAATELLGGRSTPILRQPFEQLVAPSSPGFTLPDGPEALFELRFGDRVFDAQLSALPLAHGAIQNRMLVLHNITRLKTVEAALRQSEELYRLLAENSTDMIMLTTVSGQYVYASPACSVHLGYSNSEFMAMGLEQIRNLCYPADWRRNYMWFKGLIAGDSMPPLEYRIMRKDGSHFWVELRARPIYGQSKPTHFLVILHNIDARHRAEDAVRESNDRFNTMVENLPAVVYQYRQLDGDHGKFDYISPSLRKFDGLEPAAVLEDPLLLFSTIEPEDLCVLAKQMRDSALTFTPFAWEGRVRRADRVDWARIEAIPTRRDDGTLIWNGVRLDITARKEAEIELARNRSFIQRVATMMPDVIFVFDLSTGLPIYFNRSGEELVGYSMDELTAMGATVVTELLYPEDFVDVSESQRRLTQLPDSYIDESEIRARHKTRGLIWLNLRLMVYERAADGTATRILGVLRDVTDRKNADEQRRQLLAQLEGANQSLQDFAYVVSHDLKAPLRGVSSISRWLTTTYADKFDADGQELIMLLGKRVLRMEQMINGVLEYSRIGREREKHMPVDLMLLVPELVQDIVPDQMHVAIETPLPTVLFEPTRMRQVFQNLIDNAVKFMDKSAGEIAIGCEQVDDMWMFWVRDNGPGIASQYYERIFQLFQTLTPKDQFESTGVGLALVKRIVETCGGKIWLESAPNAGTTFYFTVPA
ncbi:MAG: PAS domain S-box protein [Anaerolineae bacterium]|nr:PAS domain S-box protein [Anaerolineae bacterium]